jgi:uncharacterized damage-inducible protein DinB
MNSPERRVVAPRSASHPDLGRLLWMLEDTRARTLAVVAGLDQAVLDWTEPGVENSIGSLLYHIALIEADYLYADILGEDYPAWLGDAFPWPDRDASGHLSVVDGLPLAEHEARLARVRNEFLVRVATLTPQQLSGSRFIPAANYEISPDWTLHHLMQHEAEHRGQITAILARIAASTAP